MRRELKANTHMAQAYDINTRILCPYCGCILKYAEEYVSADALMPVLYCANYNCKQTRTVYRIPTAPIELEELVDEEGA